MKILLFLLFTISFAEAKVQNTCALERPGVNQVRSLEDLSQNVCSQSESANDQEIRNAAGQTMNIIRELVANPPAPAEGEEAPDPLSDPALVTSLDQVAALLSEKRAPSQFASTKDDDVSTALTQLFNDYSSPERRNANQDGYYQSLRNVLSKTEEGKRVLDCFERSEGNISGTQVVFADLGDNAPTATFGVEPSDAGKFKKVISITTVDHPSFMLALLAHEFQHACNTQEMISLAANEEASLAKLQGLAQSPGTDEEMAAAIEAHTRNQARGNLRAAIDELRAYQMTPKIFDELAPYHPSFFCNQYYVSSLFGRQILNNGDYMSTLETTVGDGTFVHSLIERYTRINGYDPSVFYEMNEETGDLKRDSSGKPILLASVRDEIQREGFRVQ